MSSDASSLPPNLVNVASKTRVERIIEDVPAAGAHVIHGPISKDSDAKAQPDSGVCMAPVLLGGVGEDMAVWQEEGLASLAACMIVESDEEAIRIANSSRHGLSAAVFTEDLRKGLAMAKKIQSGWVSGGFLAKALIQLERLELDIVGV